MSVNLIDKDCLVEALKGIFGEVEVYDSPMPLYGYQGDVRKQKANIIVRRHLVGRMSNDIGFERQADGTYKAYISEYDRGRLGYDDKWLNRLKQSYGFIKVKKEVKKKNWTLLSTKKKGSSIQVEVMVA
jgi:hypothetical protein